MKFFTRHKKESSNRKLWMLLQFVVYLLCLLGSWLCVYNEVMCHCPRGGTTTHDPCSGSGPLDLERPSSFHHLFAKMATAAGERKKTACVTGGNGYIASLLIKMLLDEGYVVKTTVRNPEDKEKNSHLEELKELGNLQVFRAELEDEGSFDAAIAGCDYAFLLAAPVNYTAPNPEKELIEPAVQGTLNVLRSCVRAGTVKRVVLTSSTAAVSSRPLEGDGNVLDEESWSDVEFISARTGLWAYPVSKVLLEKAAHKFAEEKGISLVTLCPSVTVGEAPDRKVYTTVPAILSLLSGDEEEHRVLKGIERASGSVPLVHVQDVCRAHIFVAEKEQEVPDGRYICNGVDTTILETARFLADKYPEYNVNTNLSGEVLEKPIALLPSTKLIKQGFEFKFNSLAEIYEDLVGYGKTLGILPN